MATGSPAARARRPSSGNDAATPAAASTLRLVGAVNVPRVVLVFGTGSS
jgi:hypothetical protein